LKDPRLALSKRRIASIQIERAVQLLAEFNDPVCALTLASAAEEILGKMTLRKGEIPQVENLAEFLGQFYDLAGKPRPSKKELIRAHNRTRNELKHNDGGKNVRVVADFQFEAEEMLVRAIKNYFNTFKCMPNNKNVRDWFDFICS
jgi:hypothetical protein